MSKRLVHGYMVNASKVEAITRMVKDGSSNPTKGDFSRSFGGNDDKRTID